MPSLAKQDTCVHRSPTKVQVRLISQPQLRSPNVWYTFNVATETFAIKRRYNYYLQNLFLFQTEIRYFPHPVHDTSYRVSAVIIQQMLALPIYVQNVKLTLSVIHTEKISCDVCRLRRFVRRLVKQFFFLQNVFC